MNSQNPEFGDFESASPESRNFFADGRSDFFVDLGLNEPHISIPDSLNTEDIKDFLKKGIEYLIELETILEHRYEVVQYANFEYLNTVIQDIVDIFKFNSIDDFLRFCSRFSVSLKNLLVIYELVFGPIEDYFENRSFLRLKHTLNLLNTQNSNKQIRTELISKSEEVIKFDEYCNKLLNEIFEVHNSLPESKELPQDVETIELIKQLTYYATLLKIIYFSRDYEMMSGLYKHYFKSLRYCLSKDEAIDPHTKAKLLKNLFEKVVIFYDGKKTLISNSLDSQGNLLLKQNKLEHLESLAFDLKILILQTICYIDNTNNRIGIIELYSNFQSFLSAYSRMQVALINHILGEVVIEGEFGYLSEIVNPTNGVSIENQMLDNLLTTLSANFSSSNDFISNLSLIKACEVENREYNFHIPGQIGTRKITISRFVESVETEEYGAILIKSFSIRPDTGGYEIFLTSGNDNFIQYRQGDEILRIGIQPLLTTKFVDLLIKNFKPEISRSIILVNSK